MKIYGKLLAVTMALVCLVGYQSIATPNPHPNKQLSFEEKYDQLQAEALQYFEADNAAHVKGAPLNEIEKFGLKMTRKKVKRKFKKFLRKVDKYQKDCDLIVLKNGEEIEAKITEITTTDIKYKRCSYIDGPTLTKSKSDIFMVKYANGEKEMISNEVAATNQAIGWERQEGKFHVGGFLLGLFLWPIGWAFGFLFNKETGARKRFFNWFLWGMLIAITIWTASISSSY